MTMMMIRQLSSQMALACRRSTRPVAQHALAFSAVDGSRLQSTSPPKPPSMEKKALDVLLNHSKEEAKKPTVGVDINPETESQKPKVYDETSSAEKTKKIVVESPWKTTIPTPTPTPPKSEPKPRLDAHFLHEFAPKIVVVGVGGAGGNALNNMVAKELKGVEFVAVNTDAQHLASTLTDQRLQLGVELTRGLGCGANPDAGRMAAEESREQIKEQLKDAHLVFITAGMGGGTGTGAAPVVAEICYEMGIMTVGVVTLPFSFEGTHRRKLALEGVERLQNVVDTLIVIPNQNLFQIAGPETTFVDAFQMADDVLLGGVKSITGESLSQS
jgi:cell division GTPase FtsZ